jgi:hypothetical protein
LKVFFHLPEQAGGLGKGRQTARIKIRGLIKAAVQSGGMEASTAISALEIIQQLIICQGE